MPANPTEAAQSGTSTAPEQKKKKGFFGRIFGGKGNNKDQKDADTNSQQNQDNKPPQE
jgi:hypothetical protein